MPKQCPECGKYMEEGWLTSGGYRIIWTDERKRFTNIPGKYDVVLSKHMAVKSNAHAWLCRECKTVVMKYGEEG